MENSGNMGILEGVVALIILVIIYGISPWLAKRKGQGAKKWFIIGICFPVVAPIILFFLSPVETDTQTVNQGSGFGDSLSGSEFFDSLKAIEGVGDKTAWAVIDKFSDSSALADATVAGLVAIDGVSQANATAH